MKKTGEFIVHVIFFLLGLLSTPSKLPEIAWPAFLIALFLTFVARPLGVFALLAPFKTPAAASALISFAGLRGASAIVFAIVAYTQAPVNDIVFHVTFFIVLLSILFQGALLPLAAKKLSMIDHESDVMKSFTDYTEEMPVQFIQFTLPAGHAWCGQALSEIAFPPETLAILLSRGNEKIIPNGDTRLSAGDTLVLSALSVAPVTGLALSEIHVTKKSRYYQKSLSSLRLPHGHLVVLILRQGEVIIPKGDTVLEAGDVMAYVGRGQVAAGKYLQYFGVMGVSLLVIVLLHFTLKHKERLKKLRENDEELPQRSRKEGNEEK